MQKLLTLSGAMALALGSISTTAPVLSHAAAAGKAVDGPEVHWRFSLWGDRRSFTEGIEYVSQHVGERTGGKFRIELFYGEELSKGPKNLDGITEGAFEGAIVCGLYHPEKNKPLNVLDLPLLPLANFDIVRQVHETIYAHPVVQEVFDRWNAVLYMSNIVPQYEYMGVGEAPRAYTDFKGRRVTAFGGQKRAMELLGATTLKRRAPTARAALESGEADTIGFPYTYAFASYKIDELATWVTTNLKLGTINCPTVFNRDAYIALPVQYRQLLEDLRFGAYTAMRKSYAEQDIVNEERWRSSGNIEMVEISESELRRFRHYAGQPVWDAWIDDNEADIPAQELLDIVLETGQRLYLCQ